MAGESPPVAPLPPPLRGRSPGFASERVAERGFSIPGQACPPTRGLLFWGLGFSGAISRDKQTHTSFLQAVVVLRHPEMTQTVRYQASKRGTILPLYTIAHKIG